VNLLVLNLCMDADNPVLGHATAWTNALSERCDEVTVITMTAGRIAVEENVTVHSLRKERGYSEPRRLLRFYRLVSRVLRERRIDACFAHMAPLFTVLFAPVARLRGIPILLWYAHGSVTPTLRLAHAVADRCVTSTPAGFQIRSDKLFMLGQGVDVERFHPPAENGPLYDRTVISVGRITRVKRIEEMIDAAAIVRREHGLDLQVRLFGAPHTADDQRYEAELKQRAHGLDLNGFVSFEGPVPFHAVPTAYHRGGIFLNLSETGSIDKAILESMASGCIPVSRNSSFEAIARGNDLDWLVPGEGADRVAGRIVGVLARPRGERAALGSRLRNIVAEQHSLDRLSDSIMDHLGQLAAPRGRLDR
jgi:glycosyltransferase involved in cell wall biosynthesis